MTIFALRLLPLACLAPFALLALPHAHADESAAGRASAGWNAAPHAPQAGGRAIVDTRAEPELSAYAKYKRALTRGFAAGARSADTDPSDGAGPGTARAATLKLPAGPHPDGLKVGLGRPLAGGWSVTGAYSRAFGARRVAMGAPR